MHACHISDLPAQPVRTVIACIDSCTCLQVFTNDKAGMGAVDKEKVKKVVYEMSKVTVELPRAIPTLQAYGSVTVMYCRHCQAKSLPAGLCPLQE